MCFLIVNISMESFCPLVTGLCATRLYVVAFTSGISHAGSDDSHYLNVVLKNGDHRKVQLYNRPGDDYKKHKGDIWKFNIRTFHFRDGCITKGDFRHVYLQAGGKDGWNIQSVITYLYFNARHLTFVTSNLHVNRWLDGNGPAWQRRYTLSRVW